MESIASELKSQREKQKVPLSQIAADTHISVRHLQSLEEGRFDDLPGGIYNRAFLRAYCESLKLDQREILQRYESEVSPKPEKASRHHAHLPSQHSSRNIHPITIWSLVFLISATGIFLNRKWIYSVFSPYFTNSSAQSPSYVPPKPTPAPVEPAKTMPDPLEASSPQFPTESQTEPLTASIDAAGTAEKDVPAADSPVSGVPPPVSPPSSHALRLELQGKEECWISVLGDGNPVFSGILKPGEVQSFSAGEKLFIIFGNAGGVSLKINGKSAKPIGKSGEVIKLLINHTTWSDLIDRSAG